VVRSMKGLKLEVRNQRSEVGKHNSNIVFEIRNPKSEIGIAA
jgi:hypothetical protein